MPKKGNFKQKKKLRNRGRNVDPAVRDNLIQLIDIQDFRRDHLIEYLHVIQDKIGYIDEKHMTALADLLDISQTEHKSVRSDKIKTTDINILLNRVRLTKKTEFKKKVTYLSLLLFIISFVGIFSLF